MCHLSLCMLPQPSPHNTDIILHKSSREDGPQLIYYAAGVDPRCRSHTKKLAVRTLPFVCGEDDNSFLSKCLNYL